MSILLAVVKTAALAVALVVASVIGPHHLSEADPYETDDTAALANAVELYCPEVVGCIPSR